MELLAARRSAPAPSSWRGPRLWLLLGCVGPCACSEAASSRVVDLTEARFDDAVNGGRQGAWFVMFYAPWCGHCKRLAPDWEELALRLEGNISVARVDAIAERALAAAWDVKGYPTLKYYVDGKVFHYDGHRSVASLVYFARGGFNRTSDVVSLTEKSFDAQVRNSALPWLLEFYAPWCGVCKELEPTWEDTATQLKGRVGVAKIDATAETDLAEDWNVSQFPTLMYVTGSTVYDYRYQRTTDMLVNFATGGHAGFSGRPVPARRQSAVLKLDSEDFWLHVRDGRRQPWFVYFYLPTCGHCQAMAPAWEQLGVQLSGKVGVAKVDSQVERSLTEAWGISRFPTMKLIAEGKVYDYAGDRTLGAMREFAEGGYRDVAAELSLPEEPAFLEHLRAEHAVAFVLGAVVAAMAVFWPRPRPPGAVVGRGASGPEPAEKAPAAHAPAPGQEVPAPDPGQEADSKKQQ